MNASSPGRLLRGGPLVLRLGVGAVLIYAGIQSVRGMSPETGEFFKPDVSGIQLSTHWDTVVGAAEIAVGGLLAIGIFTRLVSLASVSAIGYGAYAAFAGQASAAADAAADGATEGGTQSVANIAGPLFQAQMFPMLLIAAACASLLISGAGCLSFDTRGRPKVESTGGGE